MSPIGAYTSLLVNLLYGGIESARKNRKVPYAAVVFGHITVSSQHIVRLQDIDFACQPAAVSRHVRSKKEA